MKGFRTIAFNVVMLVVGLVKATNPDAELPNAADVQQAVDALDALIVSIWFVGNLICRALTDSPIFKKEPRP